MENFALLGVIGTVSGIIFAYLGYNRGVKMQCKDEGIDSGELKANITYIRSGVDDIKIDLKAQERRVGDLSERVIRVEESNKNAHQRIDEIKDELKEEHK